MISPHLILEIKKRIKNTYIRFNDFFTARSCFYVRVSLTLRFSFTMRSSFTVRSSFNVRISLILRSSLNVRVFLDLRSSFTARWGFLSCLRLLRKQFSFFCINNYVTESLNAILKIYNTDCNLKTGG